MSSTKSLQTNSLINSKLEKWADDDEELYNIVVGLGPGGGVNRLQVVKRDATSISTYGPRLTVVDFPDVTNIGDTSDDLDLDKVTADYLAEHKDPTAEVEVLYQFDEALLDEPPNLIGNASFEGWTIDHASDPHIYNTDGSGVWDSSSTARTGGRAARHTGPTTSQWRLILRQDTSLPHNATQEAKPGEEFYVEFWTRYEGGTVPDRQAVLMLFFLSSVGAELDFPSKAHTLTTTYELVSVYGIAPPNTAYIRIEVRNTGPQGNAAQYLLDDFYLRRGRPAPMVDAIKTLVPGDTITVASVEKALDITGRVEEIDWTPTSARLFLNAKNSDLIKEVRDLVYRYVPPESAPPKRRFPLPKPTPPPPGDSPGNGIVITPPPTAPGDRLVGLEVYASKSTGFTAGKDNLVYRGPIQRYVFTLGLPGETWYFRIRYYDNVGNVGELSDEFSETIPIVPISTENLIPDPTLSTWGTANQIQSIGGSDTTATTTVTTVGDDVVIQVLGPTDGPSNFQFNYRSPFQTTQLPVAEGEAYFFEIEARYVATDPTVLVSIGLFWRDTGGSLLGSDVQTLDPTTSWQRIKVHGTAPANAAWLRFATEVATGAASSSDVQFRRWTARRTVEERHFLPGTRPVRGYLTLPSLPQDDIEPGDYATVTDDTDPDFGKLFIAVDTNDDGTEDVWKRAIAQDIPQLGSSSFDNLVPDPKLETWGTTGQMQSAGGAEGAGFSVITVANDRVVQFQFGSITTQNNFLALNYNGDARQQVPVSEGETYIFAAEARYVTTDPAVDARLRIDWYDDSESFISGLSSTLDPTTAWQSFSVSGTAPANAAWARLMLDINASAAANSITQWRRWYARRRIGTDILNFSALPSGPSVGIKINTEDWDQTQNGEAYIHGFDVDGNATDTDGFILFNGVQYTVDRNQYGAGVSQTLQTNQANAKGVIVFDTAKANPFTVSSTPGDVAFCIKEGSQWKYDNNSVWTNFTPTSTMCIIGSLETSTADLIATGVVWTHAIGLDQIGGFMQLDQITEAIVASYIAAGAITATQIKADTITANEIAGGTITVNEMAANSVDTAQLVADSITSAKIDALAVDTEHLAANAVTVNKMAANSVDTSQLVAEAVTAAKIETNTITALQIAANAIDTSELNAGAVTAVKIDSGAITTDKLTTGTLELTNSSRQSAAMSIKDSGNTEVLRVGDIDGKTGVPAGNQWGIWGAIGTGVFLREGLVLKNFESHDLSIAETGSRSVNAVAVLSFSQSVAGGSVTVPTGHIYYPVIVLRRWTHTYNTNATWLIHSDGPNLTFAKGGIGIQSLTAGTHNTLTVAGSMRVLYSNGTPASPSASAYFYFNFFFVDRTL